MQNLVFTQLSVSEVRQLIREELHSFFRDKRNLEALHEMLNRPSTYKDEASIEDLRMSVTLYNGLKRHGIKTLGQMKAIEWKEFKRIKGLGPKSWDELNDILNIST